MKITVDFSAVKKILEEFYRFMARWKSGRKRRGRKKPDLNHRLIRLLWAFVLVIVIGQATVIVSLIIILVKL